MDSAVKLFDNTALDCSKIMTEQYSTNLMYAIKLLENKYQSSIYAAYGFMRYAHEIVDIYFDKDGATLLKNLHKDTFEAIENQFSLNPFLHSFQLIVNKFKIEKELIIAFFSSIEMDLIVKEYNEEQFKKYIHGSSEAFGLMCLRVFCEGDDLLYDQLRESTCRLFSSFQKINCLRDIKSDYVERGSVYFPGVDVGKLDEKAKKAIEEDIQKDFNESFQKMKEKLPKGAAPGMSFMYRVFQLLFSKIQELPCSVLMERKIQTSYLQKLSLFTSETLQYYISYLYH